MDWLRQHPPQLRKRGSISSPSEAEALNAVRDTLAYGLVFGVVAPLSHIHAWLLSSHSFSVDSLQAAYSYWRPIAGRVTESQVPRDNQFVLARDIFKIQKFLAQIPWVRGAWITGSLAAKNTQLDDDLDIMVLTDPNRLWLTRLLVVVWSVWCGKYRPRLATHSRQVRGRWCWNLWLEPDTLAQLGQRDWQTRYTARELVQARWLVRRQDTPISVLFQAAPWVKGVTQNGWRGGHRHSLGTELRVFSRSWFLLTLIGDFLNAAVYTLQFAYLHSHQTRERVDRHQAWFHPGSWAERVESEYEKIKQRMIATETFLNTITWPEDWSDEERAAVARLAVVAQDAHAQNRSVVLVSGVFDLFHAEHQNFLQQAAQAGDVLLVAVESDLRTKELKGPDRPRQNQMIRAQQIRAFPGVTAVEILPEAFRLPIHHQTLVSTIRPDVLAVSSHSPHQEKKAALLEKFGGKLQVVHQHNPALSTTQLLSVQ